MSRNPFCINESYPRRGFGSRPWLKKQGIKSISEYKPTFSKAAHNMKLLEDPSQLKHFQYQEDLALEEPDLSFKYLREGLSTVNFEVASVISSYL